jgi:hypothetical protein
LNIPLEKLTTLELSNLTFAFVLLTVVLDRKLVWAAGIASLGLVITIAIPALGAPVAICTHLLAFFVMGWRWFRDGIADESDQPAT